MCEKQTYQTYKEAQGHLYGLRTRIGKDQYYAYKCPHCGLFHVATRHSKKLEHPVKETKYKKIEFTKPKHTAPKDEPSKPLPQREQPIISTGRMMSEDQAMLLKQLINSKNDSA